MKQAGTVENGCRVQPDGQFSKAHAIVFLFHDSIGGNI